MSKYGIPITLDIERHMKFDLNVLQECAEKYQNMDDILNAFANIKAAKEVGLLMINEATEIWNDDHPDQKKPLMTEKQLGRLLDTMPKINEFMEAVRKAIISSLPEDQIEQVEEAEKNLIAAAQKKMTK